jgi:hypothetical protein
MSALRLVAVPALPVPHEGFIDCADAGCEVNAVRLSANCDKVLYLHCHACKALLMHDPRRGWHIKQTSREEIARRREDMRERHTPQIGAGWEALRRMRKVA